MFKLITALVTPLDNKGNIDLNNFYKLIDYQVENNVKDFVLFGSTGEGHLLNFKDKIHVVKNIINYYKNKINIIVSLADNNVSNLKMEINIYKSVGVNDFLVLTPFYMMTNEKGVIEFYRQLSYVDNINIYVYHVPKRTGQYINLNVIDELKKMPNIRGIKECSSFGFLDEINKMKNKKFHTFCGDDENFLKAISSKCDGIISVVSNIIPDKLSLIISMYEEERYQEAIESFNKIYPLIKMTVIEPNPIPIKYLLYLHKLIDLNYRFPLMEPSKINKDKLEEIYENIINRQR